eukprot:m.1471366 g.1471366  ORF g.1471366 m.1471366 type:complete len:412 (+) comp25146_c0_seq10:3942-5177(+)
MVRSHRQTGHAARNDKQHSTVPPPLVPAVVHLLEDDRTAADDGETQPLTTLHQADAACGARGRFWACVAARDELCGEVNLPVGAAIAGGGVGVGCSRRDVASGGGVAHAGRHEHGDGVHGGGRMSCLALGAGEAVLLLETCLPRAPHRLQPRLQLPLRGRQQPHKHGVRRGPCRTGRVAPSTNVARLTQCHDIPHLHAEGGACAVGQRRLGPQRRDGREGNDGGGIAPVSHCVPPVVALRRQQQQIRQQHHVHVCRARNPRPAPAHRRPDVLEPALVHQLPLGIGAKVEIQLTLPPAHSERVSAPRCACVCARVCVSMCMHVTACVSMCIYVCGCTSVPPPSGPSAVSSTVRAQAAAGSAAADAHSHEHAPVRSRQARAAPPVASPRPARRARRGGLRPCASSPVAAVDDT